MLIDCPHCKARVDAKAHGERTTYDANRDAFPYRVAVLECVTCHRTLVGFQEQVHHPDLGEVWTHTDRLWPEPKRLISGAIPDIVRISLEEADRCFNAGAYSAAAVMCGRALEGVCVHYKTKSQNLYSGLKELRDTKVIDERLLTWGDELRKVRNLGAHASTEKVPRDDARDVLNFLHAICDYVFVLSRRFENFMSRRRHSQPEA
jgi:hypothetical protein